MAPRDRAEPLRIAEEDEEYNLAMMVAMEDGTPIQEGGGGQPQEEEEVLPVGGGTTAEVQEALNLTEEEEEFHMGMMTAMEDGLDDEEEGDWEDINPISANTTASNTSAPAAGGRQQQERETAKPTEDEDEEMYHWGMMAAMEDGVPGEEDSGSLVPGMGQNPNNNRQEDVLMQRQDEGEEERDEECRDDYHAMEQDPPIPGSNIMPEPLKRLYGSIGIMFGQVDERRDDEEPAEDDDEDGVGEPSNKRRRTSTTATGAAAAAAMGRASDSIREGFFEGVPTLEERNQNLMEYSLPITLPCMFKGLQFSRFAQYWCIVIVIGHTIETLVSDFGPRTMNLRVPFAWIPPLYHHLMDCFWLHPFITSMFVVPTKFGDNTTKGFWMAMALVQTLPIYLSVSFKTHYLKNKQELTKRSQKRIERRLLDVVLFYSAATLFLLLSHLRSTRWCLWVGLTVWNVAPIYLTFSYKKRFDDGRRRKMMMQQQHPNIQQQQQQQCQKEMLPLLLPEDPQLIAKQR